jgi:hypothetical protein
MILSLVFKVKEIISRIAIKRSARLSEEYR